ncbi:MAG: lipid IV(A) 3-deoxy-D-manno-octulosonic acid transferase [Gammaproteobacteria bacterium]|nr:lipid IV(A) 3-deoxy-D-manno-octulosonic acid transferase [Gammaproteobacteria bacterium]
MRLLYGFFLTLALPIAVLVTHWRAWRQTGSTDRWRDRLGFIQRTPPGRVIWVHAASLGEVQSAIPFVQALRARYPHTHVLVSSFTAAGLKKLRMAFPEGVQLCLLPYDLSSFVKRFLNRARPSCLIVIETEIWPNLFTELGWRNVPIIFGSARLSEKSVRGYRFVGGLVRNCLRAVHMVIAQSDGDAERFKSLGMADNKVQIGGNLKFDLSIPESVHRQGGEIKSRLFNGRPVLIAASTRNGEEEFVLQAFKEIRGQYQNCLLVIVPRHPERGETVAKLAAQQGFAYALRTEHDNGAAFDVFIVNTLGELLPFYAAADVAFVGGSLVPVGGHNLIEPAALGLPLLTGPHQFNAPDVAAALSETRGLHVVHNAAELAETAGLFLHDQSRREQTGKALKTVIRENTGAVDKLLTLVDETLNT